MKTPKTYTGQFDIESCRNDREFAEETIDFLKDMIFEDGGQPKDYDFTVEYKCIVTATKKGKAT